LRICWYAGHLWERFETPSLSELARRMDTNLETPRAAGVPAQPSTSGHLSRELGPLMATAVVVGTVIGSGVFRKPSLVANEVPNFGFVALVWILGGSLALLGALALAEVAVLFPRAGGNYVFLREGYGRLFGFLWGWVEFWIIRCASIAALATVFTESLHDVLRAIYDYSTGQQVISYWAERGLTIGVIVVLALVNMRGVKWGGFLQVCITAVKVGSLLAILVLPFLLWGRTEEASAAAAGPLPTFSWAGLGAAMLGVQWAYHGWMNIAPIGGEVREPQRTIPLAVIGGVGIIIFLYLGANLAYHLVIPQAEMRLLKTTPVATEFCRRLLGPAGIALASGAVMFSAFGALNGNLLVGPRVLYAMGQDSLAPQGLSAVHSHFHTPVLAIAVVAAWSSLLVLGGAAISQFELPIIDLSETREINLNLPPGKALFDVLTDFAMFGAIIFETLAVSTIFVFRFTLPDAPRPYRCFGYPAVPLVYVVILTAVVVNTLLTQRTEAAAAAGFIALGAGVYGVILRRK
jgi:amino acid transporter